MNNAASVPEHWLADDGLYDPDAATLLSESEWDRVIEENEKRREAQNGENND